MATAKKTATTKKSSAVKKTAVKRAPAKAVATTKVSHKSVPAMKSFRPAKSDRPFMTTTPSVQTFYWILISVFILALAVWVMVNSLRIQDLYDQLDAKTAQIDSLVIPSEKTAE